VVEQVVTHRRVEDLPEAGQRLVDRAVGQRPLNLALLALPDLGGLIAVGLMGRDLGQPLVLEEGEQVMGQCQLVVLDGAGGELVAPRCQPLGGELVKGRLRFGVAGLLRARWLPNAAPNIREDVRKLLLGSFLIPASLGGPEAQVAPFAVSAEASPIPLGT
jgi:hypothetical protein